jgi:hypothetical protein
MEDTVKQAQEQITKSQQPTPVTIQPRLCSQCGAQFDSLPTMNNPANIALPFFAYGLFQPGQLGFDRIDQHVHKWQMPCATGGTLWIRDGIPLLELGGSDKISGTLVFFLPTDAALAYQRICEIEPDAQYRWGEIDVTYHVGHGDTSARANALIGRKPKRGSVLFEGNAWDGRNDPLFKEGLAVVEDILNRNLHFDNDFKSLFSLQMAYLLLWSAIERYAGLRYHLGNEPMKKVLQIATDPTFIKELSRLPADSKRIVFRGDDPEVKERFQPDNPKKTLKYYYQVRSNLTHRGKAANNDFVIILEALRDLLPIFNRVLDDAFKSYPVRH